MLRVEKFGRLLLMLSAALAISSGLSGCATSSSKTSASEPVVDHFEAFAQGKVRLTCGLPCAFTDGASRKKYRSLYQNERWRDLAIEVVNSGFNTDRNYFYLGRAAEGLGFSETARIYYRLALTGSPKCAAAFNICDGFSFPSDVISRENALNRQATEKLRARQDAEKAAQRKADQEAQERRSAESAARQAAEKNARRTAEPTPKQAAQRPESSPATNESTLSSVPAPKKPAADVRSLTDL